jgi:predicted O-methyltransferase YrrM
MRQISTGSQKLFQASDIIKGNGNATFKAPQEQDEVIALRKAVDNADWGKFFADKKTRTLASASWSANEDRCEQLRSLCLSTGAKRVLEIGSFVGVAAMSMAQMVPEDGEVVSLEIDPFAVDFALDIKTESDAFWRITHMVGPAWESLQNLIQKMEESDGEWQPFDLAVIDADKAGMMEYFEILSEIPGLMSDEYVICVDVKPFKGQLSTQKEDKNDSWLVSSGQSEIDAFRKFLANSGEFEFKEKNSLLHVCKKVSLTMAKSPFASFPNCYSNTAGHGWAAPHMQDPVEELRKKISNTDWASLFAEGSTQILTAASWTASEERCEKLQALCKSTGAESILEVGSFCGVASLAMAQVIPQSGKVVSLEIDPFLVDFGQEIKDTMAAAKKITYKVGPALKTLKALMQNVDEPGWAPFDFAVIDADKVNMLEYFKLLWETPGMLSEDATVCVDITPFKCQLFVPYVKGKLDDWIVKSGKESIDCFAAFVKSLSHVEVSEPNNGLVVLHKRM